MATPEQQRRNHYSGTPFPTFTVNSNDVLEIASKPLRGLATEVNELIQQWRPMVFEWNPLHLIEEHARVVVPDLAVARHARVAKIEDKKLAIMSRRQES